MKSAVMYLCLLGLVLGLFFTPSNHGADINKDEYTMVFKRFESSRKDDEPVIFNHDSHIRLTKKDCGKCHYTNKAGTSICLITKGSDHEKPKEPYTNTLHEICFPCHIDNATRLDKNSKACNMCHNKKRYTEYKALKVIFKHADHHSMLDKPGECLKCHVKEDSKELIKIKVCAACHDRKSEREVTRQRQIHMFCFECHFSNKERKNISCSLCHSISPEAVFPKLRLIENK